MHVIAFFKIIFSLFFSEYSSYGDSVFTDTSDTCDYEDYDYSGKLMYNP